MTVRREKKRGQRFPSTHNEGSRGAQRTGEDRQKWVEAGSERGEQMLLQVPAYWVCVCWAKETRRSCFIQRDMFVAPPSGNSRNAEISVKLK